ncbi:MAG TPA: DUF2752 domain-containing protein [Mucilaginibacter sp.]|jgi:hypothetical protein
MTIFCSLLDITNWLQNHLVTCPFKKLTGIDCPGCGFQRSTLALLKGNIRESIHLYPATIPLLITALFVLFAVKLDRDKRHLIKKTLYMITGGIIMISYMIKMYTLYA